MTVEWLNGKLPFSAGVSPVYGYRKVPAISGLSRNIVGYIWVFLGAGFGGVLRYVMSTAVQRLSGSWVFPTGTLSVNLLGCLVIGFLAQISEARGLFQGDTRLFIFVGVLGGFTTFSSFGYETFQLMRDGELFFALANAILQVALGLAFVWIGYVLARLL